MRTRTKKRKREQCQQKMPLLGIQAKIKNTQKHMCIYTNTHYITLLEVYEGSKKQGGKKKVGEKVRESDRNGA